MESLSYRAGDSYLASARGRTTQPAYILDSTGRVYSINTHDLPSARSQGEPLTGRLNPPAGSVFSSVFCGQPQDMCLMYSTAGYGFRVKLDELGSKNKAGKAVLSVPDTGKVLPPVTINGPEDKLAVVTLQGRLLVFPAADLPELAKGKGNKLIQIPSADLSSGRDAVIAVAALSAGDELKVLSGKRHLTLKTTDIEQYSGQRAQRGSLLPRGFQKIEGLEVLKS